MESLIKLRPFQDEDIDLFIKWLYSPHVKQWYTEPLDWMDEIKKRNNDFNWIHHYIVEYKNISIGFCQYYEFYKSGETWSGNIELYSVYSIDYMIGEQRYLGKGISKDIIKILISKINQENNAKIIIVQPDEKNKKSSSLLKSCGFDFDYENKIYKKLLK